MAKPVVVVLTRNSQLACDLASLLGETHRVALCDNIDEAKACIRTHQPAGFVADCRYSVAGGHLEEQFLGELRVAYPDIHIILLTMSPCPEPLARRAIESCIEHCAGRPDASDIAARLTCTTSDAFHTACVSSVDDTDDVEIFVADINDDNDEPASHSVLDGMTRRFETSTPRMQQMLSELEVAARHDVTILLIGETGSGKTYLSRLIHEVSPRHDEPFLTVACGALTEELIESELFGHVKGAFTGAHADKEGKFIAAGGGTLLLDEIDVLSPEQQVKLLRVIETGEFEPVGSNKTLKSRARLVVASNLDLQPLVEQGKFRPDLYYRLNMLKFDVLPLRERKHDITPLARQFVRQSSEKHGIKIDRIDRRMFDALLAYPWPGNVRKLENVIQRAVIYCRDGALEHSHLPAYIREGAAGPANDPSVKLTQKSFDQQSLERQISFSEREIIEQALFRNNFSRTNTARDLGISRVTLYNKMKKYAMPAK